MRNTHAKKLAAKKIQEDEAKYIKDQLEILKFDWRSSLNEKMGTGDVFAYSADAQPDVDLTVVDATLDSSFGIHPDGVAAFDYSANGLQGGTVIRDSGTGTGSNGGFNIGKHLAFTGDTYYNLRWAALNPIDASALDTIVITAIRGNDVNGGEDPDAEYEDLEVWYRTKDMAHNGMRGINITPDGTTVSGVERKIIPIGSDSSGLRDWSLELPAHVRTPETQFFLVQNTSSGAEYDHYGVTEIKFRRNTPLNVVVPLDSPEAISFVRVGSNEGDPKKRKKKVEDQLKASKEYTDFVMGKDFPGMGATLDDTEQSPIGKDQVAGSFKKAGTPQKTIQQFLQTDDITGEPIEKKIEKSFSQFAPEVTPDGEPAPDPIPVNNNKNIVLGQDAQALETSADEDPAQREAEKEAEKEVAQAENEVAQVEKEVAAIEKESELTPDEKQGKSEEEIKAAEEEKKNGLVDNILDKVGNAILNKGLDFFKFVDPLDAPVDGVLNLFSGFVSTLNTIGNLVGFTGFEKMRNNIEIMRSNLTGRITTYNLGSTQLNGLSDSITPSKFALPDQFKPYTPSQGTSYAISDERHEYADDNIKVINGVVSRNDGEYRTHQSLASMQSGVLSVDGIGKGYGQMIIPKDGSTPYFHYYDYNYNNLNSPDEGEVPGLLNQMGAFVANQLRRVLPGRLSDDGINQLQGNIDTWSNNLKERVGLNGWPPGIHGATLTDVKINLDQLPQETQDMINAHPLSWTEERISKMTDDQVWDQLSFETAEDVKWFDDNYMELMKKYHPDMFTNNEKYKEVSEKLNDITKQPEYSAAGDAAREYVETVKENYKELIANVEKEIPLPKGDYPEWDPTSDSDLQAQKTVTTKAWSTYQEKWTAAEPAMKAYDAYAATLEKRGNHLYGTSAQIMKLKSLESKMNSLLDVWDKASDAWNASLEAEGKFFDLYVKKLTKERKPWDEIYEKQMAAEDKLADERDEKVKVAQKAYEDTFSVRKGQGGKLLNGGDWTHPETGEVIPGMGTVRSGLETERDELGELMRAEERAYGITLMKEQKDWIWKSKYRSYGDGKSWNPKGVTPQGKPKQDKPKPQNKYDTRRSQLALDEPIVRDNQQNSYKPRGSFMQETTFGRIKKMRKKFDYEGKPSPDGFPDNDPPELDPKTGMHPRYGKNSSRYKKLDPVSARSMPKTGDPETDAEVAKAAKKPK
tara:strand:+ start:517 stop:4107 length:3591 start_codon:yes stop_codon:yes gene_type:complete